MYMFLSDDKTAVTRLQAALLWKKQRSVTYCLSLIKFLEQFQDKNRCMMQSIFLFSILTFSKKKKLYIYIFLNERHEKEKKKRERKKRTDMFYSNIFSSFSFVYSHFINNYYVDGLEKIEIYVDDRFVVVIVSEKKMIFFFLCKNFSS